jgi:hypothetical protein
MGRISQKQHLVHHKQQFLLVAHLFTVIYAAKFTGDRTDYRKCTVLGHYFFKVLIVAAIPSGGFNLLHVHGAISP